MHGTRGDEDEESSLHRAWRKDLATYPCHHCHVCTRCVDNALARKVSFHGDTLRLTPSWMHGIGSSARSKKLVCRRGSATPRALRITHMPIGTCTDCTVPRGCMHGAGSRKGPLEIMAALTSLLRCDRGLLRWPRRLTPAARRTAPTGRDADARRAPVRARRLVKSSQVKSFKIRAL
jgi:hypothetical protein